MKYRKKSVVIDAWPISLDMNIPKGCTSYFTNEKAGEPHHLEIVTLEGNMRAAMGDMLIRGVEGEFYSCKKNIFDKTYEEVS